LDFTRARDVAVFRCGVGQGTRPRGDAGSGVTPPAQGARWAAPPPALPPNAALAEIGNAREEICKSKSCFWFGLETTRAFNAETNNVFMACPHSFTALVEKRGLNPTLSWCRAG